MSVPLDRQYLTPPQLAERWGVSPEKVYAFIRSGELRAINLATQRGGRPRYAISYEDAEAFERSREVVAAPSSPPVKRRSKSTKNYF